MCLSSGVKHASVRETDGAASLLPLLQTLQARGSTKRPGKELPIEDNAHGDLSKLDTLTRIAQGQTSWTKEVKKDEAQRKKLMETEVYGKPKSKLKSLFKGGR
jgi:hypothetical protein